MNRKQKIIVSVTGIFLVLLILMGLTYAYFLTQIKGNTKQQSISVTTANLALEYHDGNGVLRIGDKLIPGNPVNFLDENDNKVTSKTFSVENTGDSETSYSVVIENLKVFYANPFKDENDQDVAAGTPTSFNYPETLKLKITCKNEDQTDCTNSYDGAFPSTEDILLTNTIPVGETQIYTLTMAYENAAYDQSSDMNKTLEARVNIVNPDDTIAISGKVEEASRGDVVAITPKTDVAYNDSDEEIKLLSNIELLGNETTNTKYAYLNKDKEYKIIGVKPGTHDITIKNILSNTEITNTTLTINKGTEESVDKTNKVVTMKNETSELSLNINKTNTQYTLSETLKQYESESAGNGYPTIAANGFDNISITWGTIHIYDSIDDAIAAHVLPPNYDESEFIAIDEDRSGDVLCYIEYLEGENYEIRIIGNGSGKINVTQNLVEIMLELAPYNATDITSFTNYELLNIIDAPTPATKTFELTGTIDVGTEEFSFEEGMTWEDFINSDYNNGDFSINTAGDPNNVHYKELAIYTLPDYTDVPVADLIVANAEYFWD